MKTHYLSGFVMLGILSLLSQPISAGAISSEERIVKPFNKIALHTLGTALITQGKTEGVIVETAAELLPFIKTKVKDHTLILKVKKGMIPPSSSVTFVIAVKELKKISQCGTTHIKSKNVEMEDLTITLKDQSSLKIDALDAKEVTLTMEDKSSVKASLAVQKMQAHCIGSSKLQFDGKAQKMSVKLKDNTKYDAQKLVTKECTVKASGSAQAKINTQHIKGEASGSSVILYVDSPKVAVKTSQQARVENL